MLITVINIGSSIDYIFASDAMWNASDEAFTSTIISFIVNMLLFSGLAYFMIRGLSSRKGVFSSFRSIAIGILILGILLFWQSSLDASIMAEIEDAGYDSSQVAFSFVNVAYIIYFLGIAVTGFVIFKNKDDIKNWFPLGK